MLNKPKFMIPSTNVEECVVDASASTLSFSCIVDGNEAVSAWRIKIYLLSNNVSVYDTGKQTCSELFFPIDEKNRNITFKINLKDYANTGTLTQTSDSTNSSPEYYTFKNSTDEYYWTMEMWSVKDKDNENPTVKSCEEVFFANSEPIIDIKYSPSKSGTYKPISEIDLKYNKCFFKASYSQAENIPIKRYGWQIVDCDSDTKLVDTISKNQVYGVGDNILCTFGGFADNRTYKIRVFVETQNGKKVVSDFTEFASAYQTELLDSNFKTAALDDEPGIINSWSKAVIIGGKANGNVSYKSSYPVNDSTAIVIPVGSSVEYNHGATSELNIPEASYMALSTQIDKLASTDEIVLFQADGKSENGISVGRKLWYNNKTFYYSVSDSSGNTVIKSQSVPYSPNHQVWYVITMSPYLGELGENTNLSVTVSIAENALKPSQNLYPSTTKYPVHGVWEVKNGI